MRTPWALALLVAAAAGRKRNREQRADAATARKRARTQRTEVRDFYRNATALSPVQTVAAVVLSHNHEGTVKRIADALSEEVDSIVIVEDGSTDNSYEAWRAALRSHANAKIIRTPDVHEIRAYNRGAAIANADVYCFLQDDDIPNDRGWGKRVMSLFDSFRKQRLAVVSGLATEVCQSEWGEAQVEHPKAMKNPRVTRRIPYAYRGVPFAFATEAWLAPLCVRADVWADLGGFDESLALSGEPGIGLDIHLSLRAGVLGYAVGVFGALFERGVGGHGTVSSPEKTKLRLRKRAEIGARIRAVAGCRWPPEMLERARLLNEELLERRPGTDALREAREKCARFRKHPCRRPP
ncbi:unnamed protein product [Pelagomonas calceolata]|uniref:Glycosyltransferase 2-like domain-containing protein n=2 Tax=Pelagomonas calceolata TaxID=35677 RepID=A0A8J2SJL8_9STRA|nr:unnamed protein product [Pelagomonas calceolata]